MAFASCRAIHAGNPALPSGPYMIDPDGAGGDAPISVTCDMDADGGGWTIVSYAAANNSTAGPIAYSAGNARLMADAQRALIAFRSRSLTAYADYASFDLPAPWRTDTPFNAPADDLTTGVSLNGGAQTTAVLRYGSQNFSSLCADAWDPVSPYGRICVVGLKAPYYAGFTAASGDFCGDSLAAYNAVLCTDALRFSIAVR